MEVPSSGGSTRRPVILSEAKDLGRVQPSGIRYFAPLSITRHQATNGTPS